MLMSVESTLILCGFLDLFSVSILVTSLPLHLKSFNVSTTYLGVFFSLYGALQILSSYVMGYLADKTGRKFVICICALFTAIGYIALGLAPSFLWIFLMRFISGLFKQTQTLSRTILATKQVVDNNRRIVLMGRFTTFSSVGFIFGPPIGGYIYQQYGFMYITCLSSLGFLLMFFLFLNLDMDAPSESQPVSNTENVEDCNYKNRLNASGVRKRKKSDELDNKQKSSIQVDEEKVSYIISKTWDIQLSIFLLSFCPLLFRINYSLTLRELFNSTSILSGFASSYGAITGSIAGLVVPTIINFYQNYYPQNSCNKKMKNKSNHTAESKLLFHTSLTLAMSFLGCSLAQSLTLFILFQSPISFVNGLSREAFNIIITNRVSKKHVGRVMGLSGSLVAFGRLFAPIIGGMMQEISYRIPIFMSSICSFIASGIVYKFLFVDD